ncbi:hypothetical protein AZF37_09440 [endosymbiont 'TC1' of Trimyema compressum]|uniref:hypothetical protein n=1 Tax=endosymbiont 'TC1' of Trimyema compressum TaxID=243899 RepID=UPI0007F0A339|nr:hypothetical protein [endosymbiont 'TC1' of Trimyema compressum]AMP21340.1 hypothetical protein AZF37_09440 [endosymbiont 'TC1' of Trimyema compressum]
MNEFLVTKEDAGKIVFDYIQEKYLNYDSIAYSCNNTIVPHIHRIKEGDRVESYPITHREGYWVYLSSLYFLLSYVTRTLYPRSKLEISHTVAKNVYCYFRGKERLTEEKVFAIRDKMRELVTADIPLQVEMRDRKDAINLF